MYKRQQNDCDNDTLLVKVHPDGPTCHKGTDTCWAEENTLNPIPVSYTHLVSCNEDIEALETAGIPAVVFGKAFYEGKIDVKKLVNS